MAKKRCIIRAVFPITCFEVPIVGHTELNLTPEEIYKCLCAKAEIIEILPDGNKVHLNFTNYDKDNTVVIAKPVVKEQEVVTVKLEDFVEVKEKIKPIIVEEKVDEPTEEESSEEVVEEEETDIEEELNVEASPVKSYEVSSRNNNYSKTNKKGKNKR